MGSMQQNNIVSMFRVKEEQSNFVAYIMERKLSPTICMQHFFVAVTVLGVVKLGV